MHVTPEMERLIPKDTLFFNTEQLIILSEEFNHQSYMNIRFLAQKGYEFIDYSEHNVKVLESWGAPAVILMPLGYVPELDRLQKAKPVYDLLFYGGRNQRRIEVLNQIRNAGVNFHYLNGVYGPDRDNFIEQSKVVLNLHLYPSEIFELVRVNYLMHNKVCVLTELNASTKIEQELKELFVCSSREAIASTALELAHCPDMIKEKSSMAYDWLRSRPQELIIKNLFTN